MKIMCIFFTSLTAVKRSVVDSHFPYLILVPPQVSTEAQPRQPALLRRGRQHQVQRPDPGREQQPHWEALRDLRLPGTHSLVVLNLAEMTNTCLYYIQSVNSKHKPKNVWMYCTQQRQYFCGQNNIVKQNLTSELKMSNVEFLLFGKFCKPGGFNWSVWMEITMSPESLLCTW